MRSIDQRKKRDETEVGAVFAQSGRLLADMQMRLADAYGSGRAVLRPNQLLAAFPDGLSRRQYIGSVNA